MSDKKVNSKMLKNLIKEVLEEQRLDEKATSFGKYQGKNSWIRKPKVGLPKQGTPFDSAMQALVDLDTSPTNTLDSDDLKLAAANNGTKNPNEYTTAKQWFAKSSNAPKGFADLDAYVSSLGGDGGTLTKTQQRNALTKKLTNDL